jgi:hypothetical protein
MPAHPLWLTHLPTLQAQVAERTAPLWWDRAAIEQLFGVRRRQAIALLHQMGADSIGTNLAVERSALRRFLADPPRQSAHLDEKARCVRVTAVLGELRRQQRGRHLAIPLPAAPERLTFAGLPAGVELERRRLTVAFSTPGDLLEKLVVLAQAMAGDFSTFEAQFKTPENAA